MASPSRTRTLVETPEAGVEARQAQARTVSPGQELVVGGRPCPPDNAPGRPRGKACGVAFPKGRGQFAPELHPKALRSGGSRAPAGGGQLYAPASQLPLFTGICERMSMSMSC